MGPRVPSPHCRVAHGGQSPSGRDVVILLPEPSETDEVVARLERLRHPRLVKIEALGNDDGQPTIVIEPPPVLSLRQALNERTISDVALRDIGVDVLTALGALHRNGIAYGDIADHDILIADDGTGRLDVRRIAAAEEATPEARRRDIRSFGVLVSEVLQSGQTASTDPHTEETMQVLARRATASVAEGGLRSAPDALRVIQGDRTAGASFPPPAPEAASDVGGRLPVTPGRLVTRSPWAVAAAVVAVLAVLALLLDREGLGRGPGTGVSPTTSLTTVPPTTAAPSTLPPTTVPPTAVPSTSVPVR